MKNDVEKFLNTNTIEELQIYYQIVGRFLLLTNPELFFHFIGSKETTVQEKKVAAKKVGKHVRSKQWAEKVLDSQPANKTLAKPIALMMELLDCSDDYAYRIWAYSKGKNKDENEPFIIKRGKELKEVSKSRQ